MMPGTVALELKLLVPDENVDLVSSSGSMKDGFLTNRN
jgi:hypothetical protein